MFNAVLHGHPEKIHAVLRFSANALEMLLADDGDGFDPLALPSDGHYGLRGVRERVHRFGGEVQIDSKPRQGTRLLVTIPRANLSL